MKSCFPNPSWQIHSTRCIYQLLSRLLRDWCNSPLLGVSMLKSDSGCDCCKKQQIQECHCSKTGFQKISPSIIWSDWVSAPWCASHIGGIGWMCSHHTESSGFHSGSEVHHHQPLLLPSLLLPQIKQFQSRPQDFSSEPAYQKHGNYVKFAHDLVSNGEKNSKGYILQLSLVIKIIQVEMIISGILGPFAVLPVQHWEYWSKSSDRPLVSVKILNILHVRTDWENWNCLPSGRRRLGGFFFLWGLSNMRKGSPESFWILSPWRYSKPHWTQSRVNAPGMFN